MTALNARLLAAHDRGDKSAMVEIYRDAASATVDDDQRAFLLTQAYIYALDADHPACADLRAALVALGRETP